MVTAEDEMDNVQGLLSFYANGTLEPEERARVESALQEFPDIKSDALTLEKLRETMQGLDTGSSPGEFGLARLLRDIDRAERPKPAGKVLPWSVAAAAMAALFAVGFVWMAEPRDEAFMQASGDPGVPLLMIAFQPDATQAQISDLLLELRLEIVRGPSAIGLYGLDPGAERDLSAIASDLRGRSDLVESVDLP